MEEADASPGLQFPVSQGVLNFNKEQAADEHVWSCVFYTAIGIWAMLKARGSPYHRIKAAVKEQQRVRKAFSDADPGPDRMKVHEEFMRDSGYGCFFDQGKYMAARALASRDVGYGTPMKKRPAELVPEPAPKKPRRLAFSA